jgi:hypothetical protein
MSPYGYVTGAPLNALDPFGLCIGNIGGGGGIDEGGGGGPEFSPVGPSPEYGDEGGGGEYIGGGDKVGRKSGQFRLQEKIGTVSTFTGRRTTGFWTVSRLDRGAVPCAGAR